MAGRKFLALPYYSQRAVLRLSERFFFTSLLFGRGHLSSPSSANSAVVFLGYGRLSTKNGGLNDGLISVGGGGETGASVVIVGRDLSVVGGRRY